jgi:chromosomal replication initiation ATPase DnaA
MTNLEALDIVNAVAKQHGMRPSQLQHKASPRGEVGHLVFRAKCHAMQLLRDGGLSLPRIARALGYRHHQPVLHGLRAWAREHGQDGAMAGRAQEVRESDTWYKVVDGKLAKD